MSNLILTISLSLFYLNPQLLHPRFSTFCLIQSLIPPSFSGPFSCLPVFFLLLFTLIFYSIVHRESSSTVLSPLFLPSPRRTNATLSFPLSLPFFFFLHVAPPLAIVPFQAAILFHSSCNLTLFLSPLVTQWESFPASLLVLSPLSPSLNVICSAAQVCSIITLFL